MRKGTSRKMRASELSIEEALRKVCLWRRLYSGVIKNGNLMRYSLNDAAKKVGIARKSLDDFLLQIRLGKQYNFDFKNNQKDRIGKLR